MAFTLEDGTGVEDANAYIDEAFADDHHTDRGNTAWAAGASGDKQAAIIRATDYVDKRFGQKFRGFKESRSQGLEWPRLSAFDNDDYLFNSTDAIPRQLKRAVAEYALIALQLGALLPIPARPFSTIDPSTGEVVTNAAGQVIGKREKVGPIEEETRFANIANNAHITKPAGASSTLVSSSNLPEYPVADEWLKELLEPSYSVTLVRGN